MQLRSLLGATAALAMTLVVGLGLASPALANSYSTETGTATVSATSVRAGGAVTVSGANFCPGTTVTVTVGQAGKIYITRTLRADSLGNVSVSLTLTRSGTNGITLKGLQGDCTGTRVLGVKVQVRGSATGASAAVSGTALPHTGGVDLTPLWAGLGLLASGALLVGVAHSRRRILV